MASDAETPDSRPDPPRGVRDRFPALMAEFRKIAERLLHKLPAPSLVADDLVSEAYLKLMREEARRLQGRKSDLGSKPDLVLKICFGAACRDVMSARWRRRQRRREVGFASESEGRDLSQFDLVDIDELLSVLAASKAEIADVVEARVFGDLTVSECAELFGISPRTVNRRWALGQAWIKARLNPGADGAEGPDAIDGPDVDAS